MDERERLWLSSEDPQVLLRHLQGFHDPVSATYTGRLKVASDRKLRLFAHACLAACDKAALAKARPEHTYDYGREGETIRDECLAAAVESWCHEHRGYDPPLAWKADLLREIFGNPFRQVIWTEYVKGPPAVREINNGDLRQLLVLRRPWLTWNDGAVLKLAQAIHEERAWDRMPILADALEEAGCGEEVVLRHCRGWMPCPKCGGTSVESYRPFGERGESDVRLCQHCNPDTYERMVGRRHPDSGWVRPKCRECNGSGRVPDFMGYKVGLPGSCCDCVGTGFTAPTHVRGCWVLDLLLGKS